MNHTCPICSELNEIIAQNVKFCMTLNVYIQKKKPTRTSIMRDSLKCSNIEMFGMKESFSDFTKHETEFTFENLCMCHEKKICSQAIDKTHKW